MKNKVQLADIFKTSIESLNKDLNQVQNSQFWFWRVNTEYKVEGCIMTINQFVIWSTNQAW